MSQPDREPILELLLQTNRLKATPRVGWAVRGLTDVESVADHSFGVIFVTLILTELIQEPVDREKALTIALVHDLPECALTDIPAPALRYFPAGAKRQAELRAMAEILGDLPFGERLRTWWQELEERASVEGRLVRDADRLERLLQAYVYERTSANQYLEEFWTGQEAEPFEFEVTQQLFQTLKARRDRRDHGCLSS
jgi:putative hydrolase of HD superfamily